MPVAPDLTPTQQPSGGTAPNVSVATPLDAFGGGVASALAGLGDTIEKAGDHIWAKAIDFQNLQNETAAREADSRYMNEAGIEHAKFLALQGNQAGPEALTAHINQLQQLRNSIRDSVGNPAAQRMYDASSLGFMGRNIFSAAGHSGQQVKVAAIDALAARRETFVNIAATSDDPNTQAWARKGVSATIRKEYALRGREDEIPDVEAGVNSSLFSHQIQQTARTDPQKAAQMLEEHKGVMTAQDHDRASAAVDTYRRSIGSANIANDVFNEGMKDGEQTKSLEDMRKAVVERSRKMAPDDPILEKHAVSAIDAKYSQDLRVQRDERWTNNQVIDGALLSGKVTNMQELTADPRVAAAVNALPESERLKLPGRINAYNYQANKVANDKNYTRLIGMSHSESEDDVSKFMDTDLGGEQLSEDQRRNLILRRDKILKSETDDTRVFRSLRWLRGAMGGQLQAAGLYRRDPNNPDEYDEFVGGLHQALEEWQTIHKTPASQQDVIDKIAPTLLKTHMAPRFFGLSTTQVPEYREPPENFARAYEADRQKTNQPPPTDDEKRRAWVRYLIQKNYPAKSGTTDAAR